MVEYINQPPTRRKNSALPAISPALVGLLCWAALCMQSSPAAAPAEKTLVVSQESEYFGKTTVYANSKAVKMTFARNNSYLVARAPDWMVGLYNPETKACYEQKLADWMKYGFSQDVWFSDTKLWDWPLLKLYKQRYAGMNATFYGLPRRLRDGSAVPNASAIYGEYIVSEGEGVKLAPQACWIVQRAMRVPKTNALPLAMHMRASNSKFEKKFFVLNFGQNRLKTNSFKIEVCPDDFFKYMKGGRKVGRESEALTSLKERDAAGAWVRDFGFGEEKTVSDPKKKP